MDLIITQRLGKMAVHIDEENDVMESLPVDRIALVSFVINAYTGTCQFALAFGGVDSKGLFHLDPKRSEDVAMVTLTRNDKGAKEFDALFKDEKGNPKTNFTEEWFENLTQHILIPFAFQRVWGAKYPDIEVSLNGTVIFPPPKVEVVK